MNKIECDILFLIEHEDRELSSVTRIKEKLQCDGKKVVILSLEFHTFLFRRILPKIVVVPMDLH